MSVTAILALIAFAVQETPMIVSDVQMLVSLLQKTFGTVPSNPTQDELDLANAVAARKSADDAAKAQA